jgi:hypothetical protein
VQQPQRQPLRELTPRLIDDMWLLGGVRAMKLGLSVTWSYDVDAITSILTGSCMLRGSRVIFAGSLEDALHMKLGHLPIAQLADGQTPTPLDKNDVPVSMSAAYNTRWDVGDGVFIVGARGHLGMWHLDDDPLMPAFAFDKNAQRACACLVAAPPQSSLVLLGSRCET